jgi:hypothetical protein
MLRTATSPVRREIFAENPIPKVGPTCVFRTAGPENDTSMVHAWIGWSLLSMVGGLLETGSCDADASIPSVMFTVTLAWFAVSIALEQSIEPKAKIMAESAKAIKKVLSFECTGFT